MTTRQLLTAATIALYTAAVPLVGTAQAKGTSHASAGHSSGHASASAHTDGGKGGKSGGGNPFATAQSIMGIVGGVFGR